MHNADLTMHRILLFISSPPSSDDEDEMPLADIDTSDTHFPCSHLQLTLCPSNFSIRDDM